MSSGSPEDLIVAHVSYSWPEAEVIVSMLEAAGIEAILADRLTIANNWHMAVALGGFRILVPSSSKRDADIVIAAFRDAAPDEPLPESQSFFEKPVQNSFWLAFSVLFGWCPAWLRQRGQGNR